MTPFASARKTAFHGFSSWIFTWIFMVDSVSQKAYFSLKHLSTEFLPPFPQPVNLSVLGNSRI
jgi:hypothetical protein